MRRLDHAHRARRLRHRSDPDGLVVLPGHVGDEALVSGHCRDEVDVGPGGAAVRRDVDESATGSDGDPVEVERAHAEVVRARAESPGWPAGRVTSVRDRGGNARPGSGRRSVVFHTREAEKWKNTRPVVEVRGRGNDRREEAEAATSLKPDGPPPSSGRRPGRVVAEVGPHRATLRAADHGIGIGLAVGRAHAVATDHLVVRRPAARAAGCRYPACRRSPGRELRVAGYRVVQQRNKAVVLVAAEGRAVVRRSRACRRRCRG